MRRMPITIRMIFCLSLLISIPICNVLALSYSSSNYTLTMPCVVSSGGRACSANYSIERSSLGRPYGGKAQSANYSLDAGGYFAMGLETAPNPPTVGSITSPTNVVSQTLRGTKDADTAIYINGYEAVAATPETEWSYCVDLCEGDNHYILTARNMNMAESDPVYVTINLDTIAPLIIINSLYDNLIVCDEAITIEGTIDDEPFTRDEALTLGVNDIVIEARDEAGNSSTKDIATYRARLPLGPPGR